MQKEAGDVGAGRKERVAGEARKAALAIQVNAEDREIESDL